MNHLMNSIPLPYYIAIIVLLIIFDIWYMIRIRKSSYKILLLPLMVGLINLIIIIPTKCLRELAKGSTLADIFSKIQILSFFILFISIIFMAIYQYRKGKVRPEKRKMFIIGFTTAILSALVFFVIYIYAIFFL